MTALGSSEAMAEILILSARNALADCIDDADVMVTVNQTELNSIETAIPLQEFMDSPSAIGSLSHPLTEIQVELPTQILEVAQEQSVAVWIVGVQPENGWLLSPTRDWHRELQNLFKPYGKQLSFVAEGRKADRGILVLCQPHEIKALQSISPQRLAKPLAATANLAFATSPMRRKARELGAVLCGLTCLGIWHGIPELRQHFTEESSKQIRHHLYQKRLERPIHDWAAWQTQVAKFVTGKQANVASVLVSWQPNGSIDSLIEVQRSRKRLPKGCKPGELENQISCTTQGSLIVPASDRALELSTGTSNGK